MLGIAECCDERARPAHRVWSQHRDETLAFLRRTSVADIAALESRRRTRVLGADYSRTGLRIRGHPAAASSRPDARQGGDGT